MSRTQDLVIARMRLVARRWQDGGARSLPAEGSWVAGSGAHRTAVEGPGAPDRWVERAGASDHPVEGPGAADHPAGGPGLERTGAAVRFVDPAGDGRDHASAGDGDPAGGGRDQAGAGDGDPADWDPADWDPVSTGTSGAAGVGAGPAWPPAAMWVRLVGLLLAVVAIGVGALFLTSRPRAQALDPVIAMPGSAESADPFGDPLGSEPSPDPSVLVHVAGEVRTPGVVSLPAGARVQDAVEAAGGLLTGIDLGPTNLARIVADGERIEVGGPDPGGAGAGASTAAGAPLDLNSATADQLDALPGVGPVTAAKILAWRTEHGRFTVVDELAEVPGIGPKTLAELRPLVGV